MALHSLELDDSEIKLLLVAIRQVLNTFTIAEAQSAAAGEPLAADYQGVRESYERVHRKFSELAGTPASQPHIVKR